MLTQEERIQLHRQGHTVIANQRRDTLLIDYAKQNGVFRAVDRRSRFGNPFRVGQGGIRTRADAVQAYMEHLKGDFSNHQAIMDLRRMVLVCWCYPEPCHAQALVEFIEIHWRG